MERCWLDRGTLVKQRSVAWIEGHRLNREVLVGWKDVGWTECGIGWLEGHWLDKGVLIARRGVGWMEES